MFATRNYYIFCSQNHLSAGYRERIENMEFILPIMILSRFISILVIYYFRMRLAKLPSLSCDLKC